MVKEMKAMVMHAGWGGALTLVLIQPGDGGGRQPQGYEQNE
jgi:hypothetical protein